MDTAADTVSDVPAMKVGAPGHADILREASHYLSAIKVCASPSAPAMHEYVAGVSSVGSKCCFNRRPYLCGKRFRSIAERRLPLLVPATRDKHDLV